MWLQIAGGIGLFLLGMTLLTDGLKALAGAALRSVLMRFVRGPVSGTVWGALLTAMVQSSTATTLTTIGFVSAGLLTFAQSVGVIFGANLGTTSTGWLVSILGFKVSLGTAALPLIFVGAMLHLLASGKWGHLGLALAGFALIFIGIDVLQLGMKGLAEQVTPDDLPRGGVLAALALVGIGAIMTIVMQSSSAAMATTLAALHSNTIALDQAGAMVIGQNIGTTLTALIAGLGGTASARRTGVAHVAFNVATGAIALLILPLMLRFADAVIEVGQDDDAVALAAFHTTFNIMGVMIFLPLAGPFSRAIERLIPDRGPAMTRYLDPSVIKVGAVAVEAARRATIDIALGGIQYTRNVVMGSSRKADPAIIAAVDQTRAFIARVGAEAGATPDVNRLLSVVHALDHIERLVEAAGNAPSRAALADPVLQPAHGQVAEAIDLAVDRLGSADGDAAPRLQELSLSVALMRKDTRMHTLASIAKGRIDAEHGQRIIETMLWLDRVAYHIWRTVLHIEQPLSADAARVAEPDHAAPPVTHDSPTDLIDPPARSP
ncbi:MAG: Na/Pi cotransporter family protein [Phycisphaeraceae bacterium]|nr:Na/Pi cotransporter family protein [Phycisphaeraceae bacterium]MCW5753562.1 Na/Pi cotransporter family protein [Phycisphaeraceae bacterium]